MSSLLLCEVDAVRRNGEILFFIPFLILSRMLAWINGTHLTGYWGSDTPWWKVGPGGRVDVIQTGALGDFFDSLEPGAAAAQMAERRRRAENTSPASHTTT